MGIPYADIIGLFGFLASAVAIAWNIYNGKNRSTSLGMLEKGQYIESINKSIEIANTRALAGEQRAVAAEATVENVRRNAEAREEELERRIAILERNSSYRMTFDVFFGEDPKIEHVEISRFRDERKVILPVENEKRVKTGD